MPKHFTPEENARWMASRPRKVLDVKLIIRARSGGVLLVKPAYKPTWQLPGGGVDAHESPVATALRELREETGLVGELSKLRLIDTVFRKEPDHVFLMYEYDEILADDIKIIPSDPEVEGHKFVAPSDVPSLIPSYYAEFWHDYVAR